MTEQAISESAVTKFATGIPGFEHISRGGLPEGRATLVAGSSGSGKTVFGAQFLVEGIRQWDEPGVFVTFEESPRAIRANFASLCWPIAEWEAKGRWAFVDLSPDEEAAEVTGEFDLGALLPRIEHAVMSRVGARRLVIDSLGTLYSQYTDQHMVRRTLGQLMAAVRRMGITTLITVERTEEYGAVARFGVEEFVADSVVILRNDLDDKTRRRTIEILKMRGTTHQKGEYPFVVSVDAEGCEIIPLSAIELNQPASIERASFGIPDLDALCAGGLLRQSISLVAGPTGTGKTLITSHFLTGCPADRSLLFEFEEGTDQLHRNATGWSLPFREQEEQGRLRLVAAYPETATLEDHLVRLKKEIERFQPDRVAVDSLSALERIAGRRAFQEFLIALAAYLRERGITALFTTNTSNLEGNGIATEAQISSMTDTIILLRYVDTGANIKRGLTVLKMRGSNQDKAIRAFTITEDGLQVGEPLPEARGGFLG